MTYIWRNLINSKGNSSLARGEHLAKRKEVYERMHPETKAGVAGGKARQGSANEIISFAGFAADTATKTGLTDRTGWPGLRDCGADWQRYRYPPNVRHSGAVMGEGRAK